MAIKLRDITVKRKLLPAKTKKGKPSITLQAIYKKRGLDFLHTIKLKAEPTQADIDGLKEAAAKKFNKDLLDLRPPQLYPDLP